MMRKDNTPNYETPQSKIYNFKDFDPSTELKDLKGLKNSNKKNDGDKYNLPTNGRLKFNKVTKTWQTLSKSEIKDGIEAIEDIKELKYFKTFENYNKCDEFEFTPEEEFAIDKLIATSGMGDQELINHIMKRFNFSKEKTMCILHELEFFDDDFNDSFNG